MNKVSELSDSPPRLFFRTLMSLKSGLFLYAFENHLEKQNISKAGSCGVSCIPLCLSDGCEDSLETTEAGEKRRPYILNCSDPVFEYQLAKAQDRTKDMGLEFEKAEFCS